MNFTHEQDYRRRVHGTSQTRFLPGTSIEIVREVRLPAPPRYALFDFDGTLSLVREGWPEIMIPMLVDVLRSTGTSETDEQLTKLVAGFVMELNGKQTIYQMIRLAEEVTKRGGTPEDPVVYKDRYHALLMERIGDRRDRLRSGDAAPEDMLVPGSLDLLRQLKDRGVEVYLASGTDERYVIEEARLLTLDRFFEDRIFGAVDDYRTFSKQMVIERILKEQGIAGHELIGFGDGYVEIDNVKTSGGTAIAVASDESGRSGKPDPWKRERLLGVGADIVIPDFREATRLLEYLWNQD